MHRLAERQAVVIDVAVEGRSLPSSATLGYANA
jgi:hypothetical protein